MSFGYEPATIDRSVTASAYDADLQGEDKLYLSGYIRCQVPQGAGIRVGVIADGGSEVEVANITYNGDAGWRNVDFDIKDGTGAHIKATELQYVVHVENSDKATYPTANPEVDFIALQFIAAQERRRIWYARVVATDGQERLDGSANPLATRKAIVDKLVELWRSNGTLSFWEADVYASEPADGPEVTVTVSNLTEQSWRLNDQSGEVQSEVSFSLLEIGPTS